MPADLTNLLPQSRQRSLARGYYFRLVTMGAFVMVLIVLAHALLLIPSYIYVGNQVQAREKELSALQASSSSANDEAIKARFDRLDAQAGVLLSGKEKPTASAAVRALIDAPRPGISLRTFSFAELPEGKGARVLLTGTAATRDALRTYVQTLDGQTYIDRVELPISAYAEEKDISFTVTLTGPFLP